MSTDAVVAALLGLTLTACASSSGGTLPVPVPFPHPARAPHVSAGPAPRATTAGGYAIADTALALRGIPYRAGGDDPSGFDCSGFVYYVFAHHGLPVPRQVSELFSSGTEVPIDEIQAGDLLFFTTIAPGPTHVAIAIGGNSFVHAPSSSGEVRVESLSARYWVPRFLGARRVLTPS